jgi:hypothetical protein
LRLEITPGSYLALSHSTADFHDQVIADAATAVYATAASPLVLRNHAQVTGLFDGWELIQPGVVQVPVSRPDGKLPRPRDLKKIGIYGGVGRLPGSASLPARRGVSPAPADENVSEPSGPGHPGRRC